MEKQLYLDFKHIPFYIHDIRTQITLSLPEKYFQNDCMQEKVESVEIIGEK